MRKSQKKILPFGALNPFSFTCPVYHRFSTQVGQKYELISTITLNWFYLRKIAIGHSVQSNTPCVATVTTKCLSELYTLVYLFPPIPLFKCYGKLISYLVFIVAIESKTNLGLSFVSNLC